MTCFFLYQDMITHAQDTTRRAWATFDLGAMACGIIVLCGLALFLLSAGRDAAHELHVLRFRLLVSVLAGSMTAAAVLLLRVHSLYTKADSVVVFVGVTSLLPSLLLGWQGAAHVAAHLRPTLPPRGLNTVASVVLGLHVLAPLSNSMVVHDDAMSAFLLQTLIIASGLAALLGCQSKYDLSFSAAALLVCAASTHCAQLFRMCREEQLSCFSAFSSEWKSSDRPALLASCTVFLLTVGCYWWASLHANLYRVGWVRLRLLIGPLLLATTLEWLYEHKIGVELGTLKDASQDEQPDRVAILSKLVGVDIMSSTTRLFWPRLASVLNGSTFLLLLAFPACVKIEQTTVSGVATIFAHGLPSVQTAFWLLLASTWLSHIILLVNAWTVPAYVLYALAAASMLCLQGSTVTSTHVKAATAAQLPLEERGKVITTRSGKAAVLLKPSDFAQGEGNVDISPRWHELVTWYMLAAAFFYNTGHQMTVSSIDWSPGLVGLSDMVFGISGFQIVLSTFGVYFLAGLAFPLLVVYRHMSQSRSGFEASASFAGNHGDFWLFATKQQDLEKAMGEAALQLLGIGLAHVCMSCIGAALLRRHLMVWKIFAPRFLFDASCFAVFACGLVVACVAWGQLHAAVASLERRIQDSKKNA